MTIRVEHADMLTEIPRLVAEGVVCDSCITDPPYHLGPTQKRFGAANSAPAQHGRDGAMARLSGGFMGQQWDGGDIAFRPETWATVATILRPGAFLVAFGGTRTHHRVWSAIEDGGFVIQDTIAWMFGSGFPKRRDMLKPAWESILISQKPYATQQTIDIIGSELIELWSQLWSMLPANDVERFSALGPPAHLGGEGRRGSAQTSASASLATGRVGLSDRMDTPLCASALLGSLSTVSLWHSTLAALSTLMSTSTTETASNTTIDWETLRCCLSEITPESIIPAHRNGHLSSASAGPAERFFDASVQRLRTTLAHSALELATSPARTGCLDETGITIEPIVLAYKPGGKRTMQSDECRIGTEGGAPAPRTGGASVGILGNGLNGGWGTPVPGLGRWPANVCHDGSDEVMAAFPNSKSGLFLPHHKSNGRSHVGTFDIRDRSGEEHPSYGDSGSAARFFYSAKADAEDRFGSRHPTCKPVALIAWLVALVCPPGGTFLDPFAGSGTAAVAALRTGRNAILIEREAAYYEDIKARIAFYEGEGRHSLAAKARRAPEKPLGGLFDLPYDEHVDAVESYNDAVRAIGERVKAGAPVPSFMLPLERKA